MPYQYQYDKNLLLRFVIAILLAVFAVCYSHAVYLPALAIILQSLYLARHGTLSSRRYAQVRDEIITYSPMTYPTDEGPNTGGNGQMKPSLFSAEQVPQYWRTHLHSCMSSCTVPASMIATTEPDGRTRGDVRSLCNWPASSRL
jgi:hypothetical protein